MDAFPIEECSSGCESGWTLYLDHTSVSAGPSCEEKTGFYQQHRQPTKEDEREEEEDLSMVSDASSGPPLFNEVVGYQYPSSKVATLPNHGGKKRRSIKENRRRQDQELPSSLLDDTASSPLVNFSNNNFVLANNHASVESDLDYSQGFSATPFQRGSGFIPDHYGFLQSSLPRNQLPDNHWWS